MKQKILGILFILVIFALIVWLYIKTAKDRITFDFKIANFNLDNFDVGAVIAGNKTNVGLMVTMIMGNRNIFPILAKNVNTEIYYHSQLIGTAKVGDISIGPFKSQEIPVSLDVTINSESEKMILELVAKNSPEIGYTVTGETLKIPFNIQGTKILSA